MNAVFMSNRLLYAKLMSNLVSYTVEFTQCTRGKL